MPDATKYTSKLVGARVLIIGGSSGIGYAVAEASLESGASVIISSSSTSRLEKAKASLLSSYPSATSRIKTHACDLSSSTTLETNVESLFAATGTLDHVVFTAGDSLATTTVAEATFEKIQQAGMVRFFAPLLVAKHAAKHLSPGPRASITLTTGTVSERPHKDWTLVNSFGTGLQGMTRGLALDLAPVRVNLVSPGGVETPLWSKMKPEAFAELKKSFGDRTTTGRIGQAEDVAESYIYLMKDENISGSMISTNGGSLLL